MDSRLFSLQLHGKHFDLSLGGDTDEAVAVRADVKARDLGRHLHGQALDRVLHHRKVSCGWGRAARRPATVTQLPDVQSVVLPDGHETARGRQDDVTTVRDGRVLDQGLGRSVKHGEVGVHSDRHDLGPDAQDGPDIMGVRKTVD